MARSTSTAKLRVQGSSKTSKNGEKSHPEAAAAKTGSRNMAKIAPMSSQSPTSYSTLYTLGVYLDFFWPFVGERIALRPL